MPAAHSDRIFPRWMVVLAVTVGLGLGVYVLRGVLTPIFLAFLIAYVLDPVIDRFEARNIPRGVGIAIMLTLGLLAFGVAVLFAAPAIAREVAEFLAELPVFFARLRGRIEPWLAEYDIALPTSLSDAMTRFNVDTQQLAKAAAPIGMGLQWIVGGTVGLLGALVGIIIVPVFAAYLLHDFDRITAGIADLVPKRWRPYVVDIAREIDGVLGAFMRGQLVVMVVLAVLYAVAYGVLGVRLALVIGLVAGLVSFIPYVGGAVALGLAVTMCLIEWSGWGQLVGVLVAYSLIQLLEGFVITPRVVGDKVGLPAIWVLVALLVGGELFGFLGILLALPAAAVAKIFVVRGVSWYRQSAYYQAESFSADPASRGLLAGLLGVEGLPDDARTKAAKAASVSQGAAGDDRAPPPAADDDVPS